MSAVTGTDGGIITACQDEHGVYVRAPYGSAHLSADAARALAAVLLACACEADAWMDGQ